MTPNENENTFSRKSFKIEKNVFTIFPKCRTFNMTANENENNFQENNLELNFFFFMIFQECRTLLWLLMKVKIIFKKNHS